MRKKVITHPRFINKLERDLKRVFHKEDYEKFINLFHELLSLESPDDHLVEMYYASLFNLEKYEEALMFSEIMFQKANEVGDNTIHLLMILTSLEKLEKYDELLQWTKLIKNTDYEGEIDPLFFDSVETLEQLAKEKAEGEEEFLPKVEMSQDIETALKSKSIDTRLQALETLIEREDDSYATLVNDMYKDEPFRVVQSMMIAYLKTVDFKDEPIVLNKFYENFKAYTSEFKTFEKQAKLNKTIEWIVELGATTFEDNEDKIEQTIEMFINISMLWYPYDVPFSPKQIATGFISYTRVLNDEMKVEKFVGGVADWIMTVESEMVKLNQ